MLHRTVEQQEAIGVVLASDCKTSHLIPTLEDFDVIDSVLAALIPFRDVTHLSGVDHITVLAVSPLIQHIFSVLLVPKDELRK